MKIVIVAGCIVAFGAFALPAHAAGVVAMKDPTAFVQVISPNGGEVFAPGEEVTVVWDMSGLGAEFANVWFSADGGESYEMIARQQSGVTLEWRLPSTVTREAMFAVEATDLVDVIAVDESDAPFHITTLPGWANAVQPGDIVGSPSFDDGWYVDLQMHRRPIMTEEIALTYLLRDPTPVLAEVSDATIALLPLARALVPNPGTVLVQFETPEVYAVEGTPEVPFLRRLANDAVAELNYGKCWRQYVMTLPVTMRSSFMVGSDIVSFIDPDLEWMLKPAELALAMSF